MHTNFWPLLVSLGTTSLFQEPSFWSSDCFLSLSIFAQTSAHHWRLQLFRRQCTLGNGFGRTLWSEIRWSVLFFTVPNLLFINCFKLFKPFCLLFLFIYVQKLNINKTVGALFRIHHPCVIMCITRSGVQPVSIEVPSPYSVAPIPLLPRRLFIFDYLHTRGFDLSDNMEGTSIWKFGYEIGGRIAQNDRGKWYSGKHGKNATDYYLPEGLIAFLPIHTSP